MKKNILIILFFIICIRIFSDSSVPIGGGNLFIEKNKSKVFVSNLSIQLRTDNTSFLSGYSFTNLTTNVLDLYFPVISFGTNPDEFIKFHINELGQDVKINFLSKTKSNMEKISYLNHYSVNTSESTLNMEVNYQISTSNQTYYQINLDSDEFNKYQSLKIDLEISNDRYPYHLYLFGVTDYAITQVSKSKYSIEIDQLDDSKEEQYLLIESDPFDIDNGTTLLGFRPYRWHYSKNDLQKTSISKNFLIFASIEQLELYKKYFFAFQGYIFPDIRVQNYFEQQSWYHPSDLKMKKDDIIFNQIESKNIEYIDSLIEKKQNGYPIILRPLL